MKELIETIEIELGNVEWIDKLEKDGNFIYGDMPYLSQDIIAFFEQNDYELFYIEPDGRQIYVEFTKD